MESKEFMLCSSNNTFELIVPDNTTHPCGSEDVVICGIKTCTGEKKESSEEIDHTSQSSVKGTNTKEISNGDENCICNNNNTHFFIEQEMMKESKNHFIKCRVQEDSKTGCKGVLCDWKIINITETSDEEDEGPDAPDCTCRNTCLTVCQLTAFVHLPDSNVDLFTAIAVMGFVSLMSLILCYLFDRCLKRGRAKPYVETKEMQTVSHLSEQRPSMCTECNSNNGGNISAPNINGPVVGRAKTGECSVVIHSALKEEDIEDAILEEIFN